MLRSKLIIASSILTAFTIISVSTMPLPMRAEEPAEEERTPVQEAVDARYERCMLEKFGLLDADKPPTKLYYSEREIYKYSIRCRDAVGLTTVRNGFFEELYPTRAKKEEVRRYIKERIRAHRERWQQEEEDEEIIGDDRAFNAFELGDIIGNRVERGVQRFGNSLGRVLNTYNGVGKVKKGPLHGGGGGVAGPVAQPMRLTPL